MRIIGIGALLLALGGAALWSTAERARGTVAGPAETRPTPKPATISPTRLGMNLGVPSYWSQEWVFSELVKNNGDFTFAGQLNLGSKLNAGGWPAHAAKGSTFDVFIDTGGHWREGTYECDLTPGWSVQVSFKPHGVLSGNHDHLRLTIPPATPGYQVRLAFTAERDGATLDKFACTPAGKPASLLTEGFASAMKPFGVIRFMDWMKTNNQGPQTWADRPLPTDVSPVVRGASVEDMVAVANALGADPWFTMPFEADADYYRNFATYVRDHLAPGHKAYVEYSNEVWNPAFKQARDALARGKERYPASNDQKAADYYYADRVRDVMAIWSQVFAGHTDRLVRVASAQSAWTQRADDILSHKDTWRSVDALATAPYFGTAIQDIQESGKARVDKVLARLPAQADEAIGNAVASKAIADKYGLKFMTYEAGPDVLGFTPEAGRDADAILHDPRMKTLYTDYLRKWQSRVGGLLVLYDSTGAGGYSHLDYTGQPLSEAPKMQAVTEFAATLSPAR